jgi:hypothetical protein
MERREVSHETNNIMLDLETMDIRPSAVVLSIGMVKFDPVKRTLGDIYYRVLSSQDQLDMERTQSDSTVKWWSEQDKEAAAVVLLSSQADADEVHTTLMEMGEWMGDEPKLWGNGSDFDNVILASLFDTYGVRTPWDHRHNRCYRTLKALGSRKMTPAKQAQLGPPPTREGVQHHALYDAVYQARVALRMLRVV